MYPVVVSQNERGTCLKSSINCQSGTIVARFEGDIVAYDNIPEEQIRYVLLVDKDKWMIPCSDARYINHSCEPNCRINNKLEVVTTCHVACDSELTISYNNLSMYDLFKLDGTLFWDDRWSFDCTCNSSQCQKRIDKYQYPEMKFSISSKDLEIRYVTGKGRGVFTKRRFESGELIERAPVIYLPLRDWPSVENTVLWAYAFSWGEELEAAAFALGYGSLYNHSNTPNAEYVRQTNDMCIDFIALKPIDPNEEITVYYKGWFSKDAEDEGVFPNPNSIEQ
jgi:hypothetical protein